MVSLSVVERLHETFVRLCEIRSPTGEEREVADTIVAELRALGLEVSEDDAAGPAEAGAGNIVARLPVLLLVILCSELLTLLIVPGLEAESR